jgi:hypothetical protein
MYEFVPDETGRLATIAVSARVPAETFRTDISKGRERGARATIRLNGDKTVHQRLISALQELESHLSFASQGGLLRLDWRNVTEERIPETPVEEELVPVREFRIKHDYPRRETELAPEQLLPLLCSLEARQSLIVPKAFFREGVEEFESFKYIQAYWNFYFVVEGLYAQGKSDQKQVLQNFMKSKELCSAISVALDRLPKDGRHEEALRRFYLEEKCSRDIEGTLRLLFRLRGRLHHYSTRSTKYAGTPFNQREFESPALLGMVVASAAIALRETSLLSAAYGSGR